MEQKEFKISPSNMFQHMEYEFQSRNTLHILQVIENERHQEGVRPMCEMLAIRSERPLPIDTVLKYATLLDEYGIAGFSWGIAWKTLAGTLKRYRAP